MHRVACLAAFLWLFTSRTTAGEQYGAKRAVVDLGKHKGFILQPTKPVTGDRPWVWYAPTIGAYPNRSNEWVLRKLLDRGLCVCGVDVGESYGSPAGRKVFTEFHQRVVREYKLEPKARLLAQSRGGLMLYNWAAENPDKVRCIVGIYPVCDLRSYPGLSKAAGAYGLTAAELERQLPRHNPIDRLEPLAKAGLPILHIHGDADKVVPLEKNSQVVLDRCRALGGTMQLITVPGKGHAEIPEFFQEPRLVQFLLVGGFTDDGAGRPRLVEVAKIWDKGKHNAFTDLIRWRDQWYCVFREAEGHVGGDGRLRVLESPDGKTWKPVGLVEEEGIDLRDPHVSITPDDRLMIVAGGSVYRGTKTLMGRQPRVSFSNDARQWTAPQRVVSQDEWLWRVTWHEGKAYGVAYNAAARQTKDAQEAAKETKPVSTAPADWKLRLVVSRDGVKYDTITHLGVPGHPNETTLRFLPSGEMLAMVRREGGTTMGWIGISQPPYRDWKWHETGYRFGGPNFIRLPDGSLWASSRRHPNGPKTVLARMTSTSYEPVLELPSGGDTSYAGLVWHDGLLWVSYYSSHEGKSSIYLAKVQIP
jgi:pimeloyl-ACP methyl ester carboxylesterase